MNHGSRSKKLSKNVVESPQLLDRIATIVRINLVSPSFYLVRRATITLSNNFERYEREYLEKHSIDIKPGTKEWRQRKRIEAVRKAATEADLDSWDYVVLEMLRREDPRIPMKIGTVRSTESFLKLFCHGLIAKLDRPATFDELERIHAFLDSTEYEQYEDRLHKLMTREVEERLKTVVEITGVRNQEDMWDLTDEGRRALQAKRAEIIALYDRMTRQYRANRTDFYGDVESYMWALPMMVVMGLGTGAMMAYLHSVANVSYIMLGNIGRVEYGDMGHDVDSDVDFGF